MKSHSNRKCTECEVELNNANCYRTTDSYLQSKCIDCTRQYNREYARRRAKIKKEGSWF